MREADLRRHLLGQANVDDKLLEAGRFLEGSALHVHAAELEKKGVKDFQLDYAMKTLKRLRAPGTNVASAKSAQAVVR